MTPIERYYINNTKLVNDMKARCGDFVSGKCTEPIAVVVGGGKTAKTGYILDGTALSPDKPMLSPLDFLVLDAVYALYEAKIRRFTVKEVFCAMSGTGGRGLSHERMTTIRDSVEKLGSIRITIDTTNEKALFANKHRRGSEMPPDHIEDEPLLDLECLETEDAGNKQRKVVKYCVTAKPVLYRYAEISRHVVTFTPEQFMCRVGENGRMTDDALLINYYLLQKLSYKSYQSASSDNRSIRLYYDPVLSGKRQHGHNDGAGASLTEWIDVDEGSFFWTKPQGIYKLKSIDKLVRAKLDSLASDKEYPLEGYEVIYRGKSVPVGVEITFRKPDKSDGDDDDDNEEYMDDE